MRNDIFRGGVPMRPDIEALQKAFADRVPGDLIEYTEAARVIGVEVRTGRFKNVMTAYRKAVFRTQGLQLIAENGVGYRLATASQAVEENTKGLTRVHRAARRVAVKTDAIDATALDDAGRAKHALLRRHAHAIEAATRDATLAVTRHEPPKPIAYGRTA